jgi:hypothetical protein
MQEPHSDPEGAGMAVDYPVTMTAERPPQSSRGWAILFLLFGLKMLALILHFIVAFVFAIGVAVVFFISQLVVLFTGKYPEGMHGFVVRFLAWSNKLNGWIMGLRDEFPPFAPSDDPYAVHTTIPHPETSSRMWAILTIFGIKNFALLPHLIVLYVLQIAQFVVAWVAQWAILFTGAYPEGMHGFVANVMRWQTRVSAFMLGLCDQYPPFSLE